MAKTKVTRKKIDMRTLCLTANPGMYSEKQTEYKFSNGRKFKKHPKQEYNWVE